MIPVDSIKLAKETKIIKFSLDSKLSKFYSVVPDEKFFLP